MAEAHDQFTSVKDLHYWLQVHNRKKTTIHVMGNVLIMVCNNSAHEDGTLENMFYGADTSNVW